MNTFRIVAGLLLCVGGLTALPAQAQHPGVVPARVPFDAPASVPGPDRAPHGFAYGSMASNPRAFDVAGNDRRSRSDTLTDSFAGTPSRPELRFADQQKIGPTMFDDPAIW